MAWNLLLLLAALQSSSPPSVDCNDADHRALDFWIGEWDVTPAASDTVIAHSRIEKIVDCAISETYDQSIGPGGKPASYHGRSITSYIPADKAWRQFYVDDTGRAATLDGGVLDGAMVLSQQSPTGLTRMTLKPNADGSVRQHGELSTDGGKTWISTYDFNYRHRR